MFYQHVKSFPWNDKYGFCPHGADDREARTGNKLPVTPLIFNYCDNRYYGEVKEAWEHLSWEPGYEGPEEETNTPKLKGDKGYPDVEIKKMPPRLHQSSMGEFSRGETTLAQLRKNLCGWSRGSGKNLSKDEVGKVGKTIQGMVRNWDF